MLLIELTYKKPINEVDKFVVEHREFLDKQYEAGVLLLSGPQEPRVGGILLARGEQNAIEEILKQDPFYQQGIADYRIINFVPNKSCKLLTPLLN